MIDFNSTKPKLNFQGEEPNNQQNNLPKAGDQQEDQNCENRQTREDRQLNQLNFEEFLKPTKKTGTLLELFPEENQNELLEQNDLPPLNLNDKSFSEILSPIHENTLNLELTKSTSNRMLTKQRSKTLPPTTFPIIESKLPEIPQSSKIDENQWSLQNLSDFMDNIFQNKKPIKRINLTKNELTILKSIIKRKYLNVTELALYFDGPLNELYNKLQELGSNKRPEENYKFIFKRCLKHMKEKFKDSNPTIAKRKDIDKSFYEFYFRSISDSLKLPIDNFYHPRNSKNKVKNGPKTINNTYIQNICKSKLFKKDFSEYLDKQLLKEYQDSIKLKIKNLVARWTKELKATEEKTEAIGNICTYIEKNKKCKLPWSVKEVSEAMQSVSELFEIANKRAN